MHVVIYCNEGPDQGLVYLTRALTDDEIMEERRFADEVASTLNQRVDDSDGHIPNCCGHLRVEFIDHAPEIVDERYRGSVHIWSGESFYLASGN